MKTTAMKLREKLGRLQRERNQLKAECVGLARDIVHLTNPLVTDIEEMDIPKAAAKMDDLVVKQAELLLTLNKIADLEEELGY